MSASDEVGADVLGIPVKIKGLNMLVVAILAVALGYIVWDVDAKISEHHATMLTQSQNLQETMDEFVYIQSLAEEDRMKLKLSMPDSLRRKVRVAEDGRR